MNIAFIVEGQMEQKIVQEMCPRVPVRRIGCNGKDASPETVARFASTQLRTLPKSIRFTVIIFDRETRQMGTEELKRRFEEAITANGHDISSVHVCIADRNFESWMVPFLTDRLDISERPAREYHPGRNGKADMRNLFRSNQRTYFETVDGVEIFKRLSSSELSELSSSFASLVTALKDAGCWWANQPSIQQ